LDDIITSSVRAAEIIRRIRNFIHPTEPRKQRIDLRTVVLEVFELVGAEALRARITLVKPQMDTPMWVQADAIELSQVLLNVMRNAMDAMHNTAARRIDLELRQADGQVQVRVYDTGTGLSEQDLEQAGEPFYTTKSSGLGMGLSISRSILAQYGGSLTLSNTEQGTCAVISVPLAPSL
jgi:two-component system sensor histidine kinase DctS